MVETTDPHGDAGISPGAAPGQPEPPGNALTDTAWGRIAGALVSPVATFQSIRRRPTWVLALIVLTLVSVGSQLVIGSRMDMREMMTRQLQEQGQEVSEEQLETMAAFGKWAPACGSLVVPIMYLVVGLLLMVLVTLLGGELSFHSAMSVTLHGLMPWLVATLLTVVVALGQSEIDPVALQQKGGILASNLAFLAPEGTSPVVLTLLSAVNLFSLWSLVLLVLGLTTVAGLSTGAAAVLVGGLWLLWVGLRTGLTVAFGPGGMG